MLSRSNLSHSDAAPAVELVPAVFPSIEGANICAAFSGKRVAGDFYDVIRTSPERVLIGMLDIAGRRQDNLGILRHAQEIFRTFGAQLFSTADINESNAMTELCLRLNRGLIEFSDGVHSCPAFLASYHEKFGTLCYTNAGHTPGLVRDNSGISELPSTGLPLGLFSHATCEAPTTALEKCASLLLVSRGVIECNGNTNGSPENFGLERIKQLFQSDRSTRAEALCSSVLSAASEFGARTPACDDRTALALIRTS